MSSSRTLEGLEQWELDPAELKRGEAIDEGSTSQVLRGTYRGVSVAIKVFKLNVANMQRKKQEAMCRELAIMAGVDHPNVVKMLGVVPDQHVQIVTELCLGGSVFSLLYEHADVKLSWKQRLKMLTDIAVAMGYLHYFDPPIIHRDLKSLNLLLADPVTSSKCEPVVKVTDFGLARLVDWENGGPTNGVGTIHWMAPEVLLGHAYDERADVYSYGCIMFELIYNKVPFQDVDPSRLAKLKKMGVCPQSDERPALCPDALHDLMETCWKQEPKLRPDFAMIEQELGQARGSLTLGL
mmetsp:Transcript_32863/g.75150  ORF Transcript_32863/g.75150 Transcript_32863/m.75150 type:complete len:295 (-) Transcript_32863:105-989(-)